MQRHRSGVKGWNSEHRRSGVKGRDSEHRSGVKGGAGLLRWVIWRVDG